MHASTGRTDMTKGEHSWLGVDQWGRRSSKGVDCHILTQGLIGFDRILIPPRYTFFFGSPTEKNSRLGVLGLEQFHDGWPIEKSSQVHISEDKSVQKRLELVCRLVYDPRWLLGVMTIRSRVAGVLQ
jgi:hypothetical protein